MVEAGSQRALMDANENYASRTEYDAYGVTLDVSGTSERGDFAFGGNHGYVLDRRSGMQMLGARYYLPAIGRFLTQDPIGHKGGLNLYAYCGNNPVNSVDPTGTDSFAYVFHGNEGLSGEETVNSLFGTHSMLAIQTPDGQYLSATYAGSWDVKLGVDPYDFGKIYLSGVQTFGMRAETTKKQELAMLNRLASVMGFASYSELAGEINRVGKITGRYEVSRGADALGYNFNIVTNNCTTRVWDILGYGGYRGMSPHPNGLFELRDYYNHGTGNALYSTWKDVKGKK